MTRMIYGISMPFGKARELFLKWRCWGTIQQPKDFDGRTSHANGLVFCCMNDCKDIAIGIFVPPNPYAIPVITEKELCQKLEVECSDLKSFILGEDNVLPRG